MRLTMTPKQAADRERLLRDFRTASERAAAIGVTHGWNSTEFATADRIAGQLSRRIREIDGDADKHWMA